MEPNLTPAPNYCVAQVALASPLRRTFDYLVPAKYITKQLAPGIRVKVPFRKAHETGVIIALLFLTDLPERPLKEISEVLDIKPLLTPPLLEMIIWASQYYHHAIGDCVMSALPSLLRQGLPAQLKMESLYTLTPAGTTIAFTELARAPQQAVALAALKQHSDGCTHAQLKALKLNKASVNALVKKGLAAVKQVPLPPVSLTSDHALAPLALNDYQKAAVESVAAKLNTFQTFLLYGVTGSGKTEVYLRIIEQVLAAKQQALVLIPEIGLTPQTILRFQQRFKVTVVALHSGLTDRERLNAWLMAKTQGAAIVIGTRSAIFTPLAKLGLIIIDEEHDLSFKQQDGFRYSARDLAIMRGRMERVPVVLGSATPSLESLYNVQLQRYHLLKLPKRAGSAIQPNFKLVDIRHQQLVDGILSPALLTAINQHLASAGQVLLFLNRRGYAPVWLCHDCGWIARCRHCDANMTFHRTLQQLQCHHCGATQKLPKTCPDCRNSALLPIGFGTERLEQTLLNYYSKSSLLRIDRDSTRRKGSLEAMFDTIHTGQSRILIGTQMLAKGHHFPEVTLVGILNADGGLYSVDFRAIERLAQLITQVAGRAGRADRPGEVLIQTHNPDHPLLQHLIQYGYLDFAKYALQERQQAMLPPFSYQVLVRAEAAKQTLPHQFLTAAKEYVQNQAHTEIQILGPVPAIMEKKGGRHRAQLLLQAKQRQPLQLLLDNLVPYLELLPIKRQVRWTIDVDPLDMM